MFPRSQTAGRPDFPSEARLLAKVDYAAIRTSKLPFHIVHIEDSPFTSKPPARVLEQPVTLFQQLFPHCVLAIRAYAYTGGRAKIRAILISLLCCYIVLQLWVYLSSRQLETKTFALVGRSGCYRNWESLRPRIGYILVSCWDSGGCGIHWTCHSGGIVIFFLTIELLNLAALISMGYARSVLTATFSGCSYDKVLDSLAIHSTINYSHTTKFTGLFLFAFMMFANILSLTSFLGQPKPWEPFAFGAVLVTPNLLSCRFILELREARASKAEQDIVLQDFSREMRRYLAEEDAEVEQGPRTINSYS
ncbi:hypothetical protein D9756_010466 [Leucocoprinus leucothites]|uniref:Uncharacterized protein n=1 Tax=Leucocoprinus leucothites TaxID=201217 RepID=A0A8H5FTP3_9AGAR|nr:hypothetical protein D9756_010466 [Leucoagaricus leucothites]